MSTGICTTNLFTPTLLTQSSLDSRVRQWSAFHTKPRQEKALARDLLVSEIPFYLPLVKKTVRYGNRRVVSTLPLFPSYLFFLGSDEERLRALQTNRILHCLAVDDPAKLHYDLLRLEQMIASGLPMTAESRLQAGQRVRIRRGALAGLEGTILVRRGMSRLLISVDFLQKGASVAVEDDILERLD